MQWGRRKVFKSLRKVLGLKLLGLLYLSSPVVQYVTPTVCPVQRATRCATCKSTCIEWNANLRDWGSSRYSGLAMSAALVVTRHIVRVGVKLNCFQVPCCWLLPRSSQASSRQEIFVLISPKDHGTANMWGFACHRALHLPGNDMGQSSGQIHIFIRLPRPRVLS